MVQNLFVISSGIPSSHQDRPLLVSRGRSQLARPLPPRYSHFSAMTRISPLEIMESRAGIGAPSIYEVSRDPGFNLGRPIR